jgi:RND family efflux transporter MFP subunit
VLQGLIALTIVFGAAVIMQRMLADREPPRQRPVREQVFTVQTVPVQRGNYQPEIQVFGTLTAGNVIELRSELAGPLIAVHLDLRNGAVLPAGTVIAELDPFEFETAVSEADVDLLDGEARLLEAQARLSAAGTDVENAVAQLELAERDVERAQALVSRGSVTRQSLDQRQQALLQAKASVDSARTNLKVEQARLAQQNAALKRLQLARDRAERNLTLTRLVAPTDVIVESESVSLGQVVTANQIVAQLVDLSSLEVQFTLSDGQYGRLTQTDNVLPGSDISVRWTVGSRQETVEAVISRVASSIATDRGGVMLIANIQNLPSDTDLRPGAFVEVILPDRVYEDSILVPETALYDEQRIYIAEEGRLRSMPVSVLAFWDADVIIQADLEDGARVLTTRISEVGEGLRVREAGETALRDAEADSSVGKPGDGRTRGATQ